MTSNTNKEFGLCAGCRLGTIKESDKPYCDAFYTPGSEFCNRRYSSYGDTVYLRSQLERIRIYIELRKAQHQRKQDSNRTDREIEAITKNLIRYNKCPSWRTSFGYVPPDIMEIIGSIR
jgi:hypothetical protein